MIFRNWSQRYVILYILVSKYREGYSFTPHQFVGKSLQKQNLIKTTLKSVADKTKAIERLEKVLERQKLDVKETEELLRKLESTSANDISETIVDSLESENGTSEIKEEKKGLDLPMSMGLGVDYGFISRSEGNQRGDTSGGLPVEGYEVYIPAFDEYGPPTNFLDLGLKAFFRNLRAIRGEYTHEDDKKLSKKQKQLHDKLSKLTLNSTAIWEREKESNHVEAPLILNIPYLVVCYLLDYVFEGRYVPSRFYLLETVARVPYFSYISMLHLYETLGWWRRSADIKRVHFAEEWNEFHHLLIMESLGGDQEWWVRFLALHAAIVYYWTLVALWMISPTLGYKFSELLETHAVNTYSQFLDENEELLKELPPSISAIEYYCYGSTDPLFSEYQTSAAARGEEPRRPGNNMKTLHDVFSAIRDDEGDHVSTMKACLDPKVAVNSPSVEKQILIGGAVLASAAFFLSTGDFLDADLDLLDSTEDILGAAALGEQLLSEDNTGIFDDVLNGGFSLETLDEIRKSIVKILALIFNELRF